MDSREVLAQSDREHRTTPFDGVDSVESDGLDGKDAEYDNTEEEDDEIMVDEDGHIILIDPSDGEASDVTSCCETVQPNGGRPTSPPPVLAGGGIGELHQTPVVTTRTSREPDEHATNHPTPVPDAAAAAAEDEEHLVGVDGLVAGGAPIQPETDHDRGVLRQDSNQVKSLDTVTTAIGDAFRMLDNYLDEGAVSGSTVLFGRDVSYWTKGHYLGKAGAIRAYNGYAIDVATNRLAESDDRFSDADRAAQAAVYNLIRELKAEGIRT